MALVACMRKLLIVLNAIVRDRKPWDELRVPWTALTATFRGQRVWFAPKFEPAKIRTVGFIIARQPGPFKLEVDWIKLWT